MSEVIAKPPTTLPKPDWLKVKAPTGQNYHEIKELMKDLKLATVCQEARCPNIGECWSGGTATIMIMGDTCTRGCRFCNVKTGNPKGLLDPLEPEKVAQSIAKLNLSYVVITTVDRDDLPDQGASHFARTVKTLKEQKPGIIIEVLAGDFRGDLSLIKQLCKAEPDVYAHNLETVERLTPTVRDRRAGYQQSLNVLKHAKDLAPDRFTKSSLMLGLGETDDEVLTALNDLRQVGCDIVTFGQYLQPTPRHLKVKEYISPEKFEWWKQKALDLGFIYVASGPLVRSSYKAGELFIEAKIRHGR